MRRQRLSILSEYYDIIRHEGSSSFVGNTIELVPKGFNKAVGIAAVIRLFDIPWENTVVLETATMILPCLNTLQQRLPWEMLLRRSKNWQIMLRLICSTTAFGMA